MPSIMDILTGAGAALDLPGSSIRDVLAGKNPIDQYKTPFSFDNRTMGRGLLEQYGLLSPNQPGLDMGDVAGFGVDVATDPLNLLMGGILGKTARAASSARRSNAASEALRSSGAMPEEIARATQWVDEAGMPRPVFHGTDEAFDTFDLARADPANNLGRGLYFTDDPAVAGQYGSNVSEHFVDVRNPLMRGGMASKADLSSLIGSSRDPFQSLERLRLTPEALTGQRPPPRMTRPQIMDLVEQQGLLPAVDDALRAGGRPQQAGFDAVSGIEDALLGHGRHRELMLYSPNQVYAPQIAPAIQNVPRVANPSLMAALGLQNTLPRAAGQR